MVSRLNEAVTQARIDAFLDESRSGRVQRLTSIAALSIFLVMFCDAGYVWTFVGPHLLAYLALFWVSDRALSAESAFAKGHLLTAAVALRIFLAAHASWAALDLRFVHNMRAESTLLITASLVLAALQAQPSRLAYALTLFAPAATVLILAATRPVEEFRTAAAMLLLLSVIVTAAIRQNRLATNAHLMQAESAERARRERKIERRYRLLAENANDIISRYGLDGTIRYVSPACAEVLGFAPKELVGQITLDLIYPDDLEHVRAQFAGYLTGGAGASAPQIEHRVTRKDGRVIWLEGRPKLVRDEKGQPVEFHDVMRDITPRKELEFELRQARLEADDAARVKSDFLANMSHELRTPLTSIIGFSDLLIEAPELASRTRGFADRVKNASRALLATVNDILDFSKLEAGQVAIRPAPTDIALLCHEALELFLPQGVDSGIHLSFESPTGPIPRLLVDPDRLRQIVLNLVSNAVKFTSKGSVVISVSFRDDRLKLQVRDTGSGIPPEAVQGLFQRFSQVDASSTRIHGGTGLGLAICRGLAEAMGGAMSVESTVGSGSAFTLELPATECPAQAPETMPFDGLRVLVVDDQETSRLLARVVLQGAGAEVTEAVSGDTAMVLTAEAPFDVILVDLNMPGLAGKAVLQRIRAEGGPNDGALIFAYTASAGPQPAFDGLIAKPVSASQMLDTIAKVLLAPAAAEPRRVA